jgi:hypothetical protein
MLGSCNYLNENNNRCNKTFSLNNLFFRDPYAPTNSQFVDLCKWHYEEIIRFYNDEIQEMQRERDNLRVMMKEVQIIAKKSDIYYKNDADQMRYDNLRALIKIFTTAQCKNIFCKQRLSVMGRDKKIYSVHTFKSNGKRHYSFYFCSLKCYNIVRAKCGLPVPLLQGQHTLNL